MPDQNVSIGNSGAGLKRAFLCHLPHRVAAVEDAWCRLRDDEWQRGRVEQLFQRVQSLAGACSKFGLARVGERVLSLEIFLSSFVDTDFPPKVAQVEEMDEMVNKLREVAALVAGGCSDNDSGQPERPLQVVAGNASRGTVYVLEGEHRSRIGLCPVLNTHGFDTRIFTDVGALGEGLRGQRPAALISDLDFLPGLRSQGIVEDLRQAEPSAVPLLFTGDTSSLEQRLEAMRAGSDAFLPSSLDNEIIAAKVVTLVAPGLGERYRVLIVEDDPTQAAHVAAILGKAQMETRSVMEPLKVLDTLREFQPHLVLMDLYMPDADGAELTTIIREYPEFIDIPIVFLSGEQDPDKQLSALGAGGEDFLPKPIRPARLIKTVTNRIRRARELETTLTGSTTRDNQTGLLNRRALLEHLQRLLAGPSASDMAVAVLFVGLDSPEGLLDAIGLGEMDALMAKLGTLIAGSLQSADTLARFGDYSFALVARRPEDADLIELAEFLCKTVAGQLFEVGGRGLSATVSIGIHPVKQSNDDAAMLVSRAEKAYRVARDAGGDRYHVYVPSRARSGPASKSGRIENLIAEALEDDSFHVLFQPMVPLRGGEGEHYQTLLRLRDDKGEFIPAGEFIPLAEASDLIVAIDRWVTEFALKVINEKQQQGRKIHLSVSQSIASVHDVERISWLRRHSEILGREGVELTFEFGISAVASHLAEAKAYFESLQSLGVSILLTQVSAEAADLKLVKHLGVDYVKLAFQLLRGKQEALASVIGRIHELGKPVIAPRIEDPRVIAQLWISGVDFIQGNFIQRPDESLGFDFSEAVLA